MGNLALRAILYESVTWTIKENENEDYSRWNGINKNRKILTNFLGYIDISKEKEKETVFDESVK